MKTVVPEPNPLMYVVPEVAPGGVFSTKAIRDAVAAAFEQEAKHQNAEAVSEYEVAWGNYKAARDAKGGLPVENVPEPTPEPSVKVVRDGDGNPGWFVDVQELVTPVRVYSPPATHPADQLGTSLLIKNAPVGDTNLVGFSFVDVSGQYGPAGTVWTKVARQTPFGVAVYYEGK